MRPIDQAHGFATLANGGVEHDPYFVTRVTDSQGAVLLDYNGDAGDQVFEEDVVNDTTYAMTDVAAHSRRSLDGGREVASKTGTQGQGADNSDAWMVGFTPSISTAVWMGNDSPANPIEDVNGRIIYGSGLPGAIWQEFMDTVLEGTPEEDLPNRAAIRGDTGEGVPAPAPQTRAPSPVTAQPSQPSTGGRQDDDAADETEDAGTTDDRETADDTDSDGNTGTGTGTGDTDSDGATGNNTGGADSTSGNGAGGNGTTGTGGGTGDDATDTGTPPAGQSPETANGQPAVPEGVEPPPR
jgi:membrane peptidoglycan carboxypeptidase